MELETFTEPARLAKGVTTAPWESAGDPPSWLPPEKDCALLPPPVEAPSVETVTVDAVPVDDEAVLFAVVVEVESADAVAVCEFAVADAVALFPAAVGAEAVVDAVITCALPGKVTALFSAVAVAELAGVLAAWTGALAGVDATPAWSPCVFTAAAFGEVGAGIESTGVEARAGAVAFAGTAGLALAAVAWPLALPVFGSPPAARATLFEAG